jgi:hypothetical protein
VSLPPGANTDQQNRAQGAAIALDAYAHQQLGGIYGGVSLEAASTEVVIYLTRMNAMTEGRLRAEARGVPITFRRVEVTWTDLKRLQDQLGADSTELRRNGYLISYAAVDPRINKVRMAMVRPTEAQVAAMMKLYGPNLEIESVNQDVMAAPLPRRR